MEHQVEYPYDEHVGDRHYSEKDHRHEEFLFSLLAAAHRTLAASLVVARRPHVILSLLHVLSHKSHNNLPQFACLMIDKVVLRTR